MSNTINSIYNNTIWALSNQANELNRLQEMAATGQKVNKPSDNPASANRLLEINSELREIETDLSSIGEISSRLEMSSSLIQNITDQIGDIRARITNILSGVQSGETADATRLAVAEEFDDLLEQFVSLANSQKAGSYLFAGSDSSNPPYETTRNAEGDIVSVKYVGSYDERKVKVASGVEMPACLVGEDIFKSDNRSAPEFIGETGAKPGSGTSTIRGTVWLEITEPSPGVWRLSIDDDLSSYVDIPPASENTMVTNSKTGEVLYVDTTNITSTGLEAVAVDGTYDIFNSLIGIRDLLRSEQDISGEQFDEMLNYSVEALGDVNEGLTRAFTYIGGRIETLECLKDSLEDIEISSEQERSRLQDADIAKLSVDITELSTLYQMTMNVAGKVFNLSILDYI